MSSCNASRKSVSEHTQRTERAELRADTLREQVLIAVNDTVREVTTVTVVIRQSQEPDTPDDTLRITTVTDRKTIRSRDRVQLKDKKEVTRIDSVYVKRDSIDFQSTTTFSTPDHPEKKSAYVASLKWAFWILAAIIVLIIVVRIRK